MRMNEETYSLAKDGWWRGHHGDTDVAFCEQDDYLRCSRHPSSLIVILCDGGDGQGGCLACINEVCQEVLRSEHMSES